MKNYNCSIRIHSRHHLELKSEYPLFKDSRKTSYQMDLYFFSPSQLGITEKRIGVRNFIDNIHIYTRFSTPVLSLKMLSDSQNSMNPLGRIRRMLEIPEQEQPGEKDSLLYELQVLANVYRSEVDNTVDLLGTEIQKQNRDKMCIKRIELFLSEMQSFLKEFRKLNALFISPRITDVQRTALAWADESISIISERALNRLFSHTLVMAECEDLLKAYEKITRKENEYRKSMNYQYLYREEDPHSGERMAYRESILKKWSQSAMYMTREESRTPGRIGHIVAGTAAGVAMIFAVLVTIFAGRIFIPNSTPWILLVVISYIFKDRIKEILREYFKRILPRFTSDQHSLLYDPSIEKKVGAARGYAGFKKAGDAPGNILQLRYLQPNPFQSILPEQDLIHYQRIIELNSRKLSENHSRLSSVTEIIRFNIADWLREMDDPKDVFYQLRDIQKVKIKGNRVYKIHLIMSLKNNNLPDFEELYHYCVILNKIGIIRIEDLTF